MFRCFSFIWNCEPARIFIRLEVGHSYPNNHWAVSRTSPVCIILFRGYSSPHTRLFPVKQIVVIWSKACINISFMQFILSTYFSDKTWFYQQLASNLGYIFLMFAPLKNIFLVRGYIFDVGTLLRCILSICEYQVTHFHLLIGVMAL